MRELFQSPYFVVTVEDERRILRRARTEQAFPSIVEAEIAYASMLQVLDSFERPQYALLADMRLAPPRNDAAFEEFVKRYYSRLYGGFRRSAALVKTQAGRLQLSRMVSDNGNLPVRVFVDEGEALAYLEGEGEPEPRASSRRGF